MMTSLTDDTTIKESIPLYYLLKDFWNKQNTIFEYFKTINDV